MFLICVLKCKSVCLEIYVRWFQIYVTVFYSVWKCKLFENAQVCKVFWNVKCFEINKLYWIILDGLACSCGS